MNFKFLFILSSLSLGCSAQVWIDTGATWYYSINVPPFNGIKKFEYVQDVTQGGELCQEITSETTLWGTDQWGQPYIFSTTTHPSNYTYANGDTIFYWSESSNQFYTLYDFGASIGDQWQIGGVDPWGGTEYCHDDSFLEVIDTGSINVNSMTLRTITLRPTDSSSLGLWGTFAERIGFLGNGSYDYGGLFPYIKGCDDNQVYEYPGMWLNCFEDESFPLYNPGIQSCQYYLNIDETYNSRDFSVFPNPANHQISINSNEHGTVRILDFQGKVVLEHVICSINKIDISEIEPGMYFVYFFSSEGYLRVEKLIVE